ncbi:CubicO group peptidase, beta-lactamase class C family [Lentibacillus halodurans]|uniref:CubicO group peptidase, beta-lactamase class C family n=1 Tax=Lentibacillus halodurans TaxID=237679 RepID=A0A1I0YGM0_9BACI|nr:serine hydrolase [Lentibacillus halodurans]SFB12361.1 CubicO group peptidase, beta-lactamase class C family [Lentibacillus halodurans]
MNKVSIITLILVLLLSVSLSPVYAETGQGQLSHGSPQSVGMDKEKLAEIDDIVQEAIHHQVTPGAVILVAKDNKIVLENAYGYAEKYDMGTLLKSPQKMTKKTIFDLASVTKVMGTTQGIMKLVSEGRISVTDKVSKYIPEFAKNGKEDVTITELLTHTSGLTPWEPTYLYAHNPDEVLDYINHLSLEYETGTDRRYSDFSFMTLGFIIEEVTGQNLNEYLKENVYEPLKMKDTMFNAAENTNKQIAATSFGNPYEYKMIDDPDFGYYVEEDADKFTQWRNYTLQGEVNDGNSYYAHNGVAGHAGLFSTARDLAVLGQTMLNNGSYGKVDLYNEDVIEAFTSQQRFGQGYGWEKDKAWYMGDKHSQQAFGHTGFTGTQVMFDPKYNLQVIVLTNKQNNGPLESGSYPSTGSLSKAIANTAYESFKK